MVSWLMVKRHFNIYKYETKGKCIGMVMQAEAKGKYALRHEGLSKSNPCITCIRHVLPACMSTHTPRTCKMQLSRW